MCTTPTSSTSRRPSETSCRRSTLPSTSSCTASSTNTFDTPCTACWSVCAAALSRRLSRARAVAAAPVRRWQRWQCHTRRESKCGLYQQDALQVEMYTGQKISPAQPANSSPCWGPVRLRRWPGRPDPPRPSSKNRSIQFVVLHTHDAPSLQAEVLCSASEVLLVYCGYCWVLDTLRVQWH